MNCCHDGLSIDLLLNHAALRLRESNSPFLDAQVLLMHSLHVSRSFLFAHGQDLLSKQQAEAFESLIKRRIKGEPIAYILGHKEFWSREFYVDNRVLIPRPETELLVEWALDYLSRKPQGLKNILDLGTGSGVVAITLACECPACQVVAVDSNFDALEVARLNANRQDAMNVRFLQGDWFEAMPFDSMFDVIVSNPPYVEEGDLLLQQGDVRFEPRSALISGVDGLKDIRKIVKKARSFLKPGGMLMFEHGFAQGPAVRDILNQFAFDEIVTHKDLAGLDRVTLGKCLRKA